MNKIKEKYGEISPFLLNAKIQRESKIYQKGNKNRSKKSSLKKKIRRSHNLNSKRQIYVKRGKLAFNSQLKNTMLESKKKLNNEKNTEKIKRLKFREYSLNKSAREPSSLSFKSVKKNSKLNFQSTKFSRGINLKLKDKKKISTKAESPENTQEIIVFENFLKRKKMHNQKQPFSKNDLEILQNIKCIIEELEIEAKPTKEIISESLKDEYQYQKLKLKKMTKGFHFISNFKTYSKNHSKKTMLVDSKQQTACKLLSTNENSYFSCNSCKNGKEKINMTSKISSSDTNESISNFTDLFIKKKLNINEAETVMKKIKKSLKLAYNAKKAKNSLEGMVSNILRYYKEVYDENFFTNNFISIVNRNLNKKKINYNFKSKYFAFKEMFSKLVDKMSSLSGDLGKQIKYIVDVNMDRVTFEKLLLNKITEEIFIFLDDIKSNIIPMKKQNEYDYQTY